MLPYNIYENCTDVLRTLCVVVVITILAIVCPYLARDKVNKIFNLQYTSAVGRNLLSLQFIISIGTAFIISTIEIICIIVPYIKSPKIHLFLNNYINSFDNSGSWIDITLNQYILICIGMIYIIAFATTFIAFCISRLGKTYICSHGSSCSNYIYTMLFMF